MYKIYPNKQASEKNIFINENKIHSNTQSNETREEQLFMLSINIYTALAAVCELKNKNKNKKKRGSIYKQKNK